MVLDHANLEAVQCIERWLEASIRAHQTGGVETDLSTAKYRRLGAEGKALGFDFFLIYVVLDSVERNIERVELRGSKGGRDVPEDKLRKRHANSLQQLPWFLEQADKALIFDNSADRPRTISSKADSVLPIDEDAPPILREALKSLMGD